jgi:hypothetical protein
MPRESTNSVAMRSIGRALTFTAMAQGAFGLYLLFQTVMNVREAARCHRESKRIDRRDARD